MLREEFGPRKAEAYIEALMTSLEELDSLRDKSGKIKDISELDVINSLKRNFGGEWQEVYNRIKKENGGDMEDDNDKEWLNSFIPRFNTRGKYIQTNGYSKFLEQDFERIYKKDLQRLRDLQALTLRAKESIRLLYHKICRRVDVKYLDTIFAGDLNIMSFLSAQTRINKW